MNIVIELSVKFRAFGMTFGQLSRNWKFPIDIPLTQDILHFNEKGVKLDIVIK